MSQLIEVDVKKEEAKSTHVLQSQKDDEGRSADIRTFTLELCNEKQQLLRLIQAKFQDTKWCNFEDLKTLHDRHAIVRPADRDLHPI